MATKPSLSSKARQHNVANALASARIEGISLTKRLEKDLADYVTGKKSIAQLLEETKQRYVTLRRG
jgi:dTDP-4-amino-4,6-dideoxygalactose transaminase